MALTVEQIDSHIVTLQNSMAKGYASIEYEGIKRTYNSPSEIQSAIAYFERIKSAMVSKPRAASVQIVMNRD